MRFLFIIPALLLTTEADAACTQADLVGTWDAYSITKSDRRWVHCRFEIDASGKAKIDSCSVAGGGQKEITASVVIAEPSTCTFRANFNIGGEAYFDFATMTGDKDAVIGRGFISGGPFVFNFKRTKD